MKEYTTTAPVFSDSIQIVEPTDPAHADNVNMAPKQLLQNTLILAEYFDESLIEEAFQEVFNSSFDPTAMTREEINEAIATKWNGESSDDITAMTREEVNEAIATEWNGESSDDPTAMTSVEVDEATI